MSGILGLDCKAYRNTGTYGSPTWNEMTPVIDVSLKLTKAEGDISSRASGYKKRKAGLKDASVDMKVRYDTSPDDFAALNTTFFSTTSVEYAFMDGAIATTGQQGLRATMQAFDFSIDQPLEDGVAVAIALKVTDATNDPSWYTVP